MIKLLIGGSPCTHWSIAQKNGRETKPEGLGWELFKNYLIAKEKFKPDFFLIKTYTNIGETVLDNCMGSGSTGVACIATGRKFIGFELEKEYFEIAKSRMASVQLSIDGIMNI